ncbi:MAG: hypothetical protein OXM61_18105 [Candidatus Poribacteria bacterium]|nr:hypothetical protein [Candidatus Poribacteria bacterium]
MKKYVIPTCVVICVIGIFAVWYFGYQSTDSEKLKGESKDSLLIENHFQEESSVPEVTQKTDKGDTAGEIETERDNSNPEKTNTTGSSDKNAVLDEKDHQKSPSAEDIAAGAAFEAYAKSEIVHKSTISKFKEALESGDSASLEAATDALKNARLNREEALRNLAPYSEAAAEILAADEARAAEVEKIMERMRAEDKKRSAERKKQMEEKMKQVWLEGFKRLSPEQQRTLLDKFPELKELLNEK